MKPAKFRVSLLADKNPAHKQECQISQWNDQFTNKSSIDKCNQTKHGKLSEEVGQK